MANYGSANLGYGDPSASRFEGRESGGRRKKLAGYLKAANEIRQSYFGPDGVGVGPRDPSGDATLGGADAFHDAAVVRSGNAEMILFPSYATNHVKRHIAPSSPLSDEETEQEYWDREWQRHQNDNAVVDVEVRGWVYNPHRGRASRKQRLAIGLARQLSGLPAPPVRGQADTSSGSTSDSGAGSDVRTSSRDEEIIAREAENIVRKGEHEEQFARRGAFSEVPGQDRDGESIYGEARDPWPDRGRRGHHDPGQSAASSVSGMTDAATPIAPFQKRATWPQPEKMSPAELITANNLLLARLRPFMANPLAEQPVSCFFYNDSLSRQHTVFTNAAGHFTCRAPLDFIPTHVRVLAGEKLSATETVQVTSGKGVSMISDIDDTIKHSAIGSGAREIFRNAFIRELGDLTISGVSEWYKTMRDIGVELHYVSNSPWQLYPVLARYFRIADLPRGSFHLKQYSGMLQGIFEPVAERKKSSLEKIMADFPDRKFIFVGDSGEADLEVYTDTALENPGRVLGIFIRDVTSSTKTGYFDPSSDPTGDGKHSRSHSSVRSTESLTMPKRLSRPGDVEDDEAELRAAIAASLMDMEEETRQVKRSINPDLPSPERARTPETFKRKPQLPPRRSTTVAKSTQPCTSAGDEDLIDFSDDNIKPARPSISSHPTALNVDARSSRLGSGPAHTRSTPAPPPKPPALRSPSPTSPSPLRGDGSVANASFATKSPPPRPRKPSTAVHPPPLSSAPWKAPQPPSSTLSTQYQRSPRSPLSQVTPLSPADKEKPLLSSGRPNVYRAVGKGLATAYNALPAANSLWQGEGLAVQSHNIRSVATSHDPAKKSAVLPPPPPLRRRNPTVTAPAVQSRKAAHRASGGGWDQSDSGADGLPNSPGEAGISKKEFLWNQRWARAQRLLEKQGVALRSWRVGLDAADECCRLVEQARRELQWGDRRQERS